MKSHIFPSLIGLSTILSLSACHPKAQFKQADTVQPVASKTDEEPSLRDQYFQDIPQISMVHFGFDSAELQAEARDILKKNSDVLGHHQDWAILVEGHCDERGTTAYNLALGQRRAAAVRRYYETLGIPGSRIATLSYGKEKPLCTENTDDCWAQNRRAVTKVALKSSPSRSL